MSKHKALPDADQKAVVQFREDLSMPLTSRQRTWLNVWREIESGMFSEAELQILCNCHRPDCVVHGRMPPPPKRHLRAVSHG